VLPARFERPYTILEGVLLRSATATHALATDPVMSPHFCHLHRRRGHLPAL
jgi:hypothetical protein